MLIHLIQLLEDDSYEFSENYIQIDAYANIYQIESITIDEENEDRCYVYMVSGDFFHVDESMDDLCKRYEAILYGSHLTKFYKLDRFN